MSAVSKSLASDRAKSRVFLVDDHPVVCHGITQLIEREPDLMVCGQRGDGTGVVPAIKASEPDIVVIDLALRRGSGFSLIKDLHALSPQLPVLVLTVSDELLYAERVLRAGAKGYLMKQEALKNVLVAIRRVLSGEVYLSDRMQRRMFEAKGSAGRKADAPLVERLSDRELEIFGLIGTGSMTRRIAKDLGLSVSTVESHRARIKEKLGLRDGAELVRSAVKWVEEQRGG